MDAFGKIILSAQGGDQVAREIGKIKKAYDDAAKSGKEIGKIGAGAGSQTAVAGGYAAGLGMGKELREFFEARETVNAERREKAEARQQRMREAKERASGGATIESAARTTGGFIEPLTGTHSDAARAWGSGSARASEYFKNKAHEYHQRIAERSTSSAASPSSTPAPSGAGAGEAGVEGAKAAGSGMTKFGQSLPYIGAMFAAGGIAMNLISTIAKQEFTKAQTIWGSGMSQRLGTSYAAMRGTRIELGREGMPLSAVDAYYSSLGQAGGAGLGSGRAMTRMSMAYGLEPSVVGRTVGLRQQAGLPDMKDYMLGKETMPQGLMTRYMSTVSNVIEEGMKRGMQKGSQDLERIGRTSANAMNAFMAPTGGNLTYTGAESLSQSLNQQYMTGGSMVQSPEQAMRFMRYRKPGESYLQTMARIQNPAEMIPAEMQYAEKVSGGNKQIKEMQLTGMYGGTLTPQQIMAMEASSKYLTTGTTPGKFRSMKAAMDEGGAGIYSTFQKDILEAAGPKAVGMLSSINDATLKVFGVATGISKSLTTIVSKMGAKAKTTSGARIYD